MGWCVGCNPPSVDCGIRLIGLPAPSGRFFIGVCLPFPHAGRPFHRFQSGTLDITNVSLPVQVDVSFLLRCQSSRLVPCGTAILLVGGVSSDPNLGPKATHQLASPPQRALSQAINILINQNPVNSV
jgi:hypothetical protein